MAADLARDRLRGFPLVLAPMVGRERERADVVGLIQTSNLPLLTLTGPAGTGKTRLAIAVAFEVASEFEHGAVFVSLASINDPELVLPTIAQAFGIWQSADQPLIALVEAALRPLQVLLVLDNMEQVIGAVPTISRLLRACPGLRILATSRVTLRLHGEQEYPVPPMSLPATGAELDLTEVANAEAVALFVQRARAVNPGFQLNEGNAAAVLAVCRHLDGLPLAIELAAARVKVLSPQALLARLGNRLQVLTGGARDAPTRLRSMREAIAWSYDLLDVEERALFRRLSVFTGGFTLAAAEAVIAATDAKAGSEALAPLVFDGIASLVDKCLVSQEESRDGEPRFRMLETIREFGLDQLDRSGEAVVLREAHAAHFAGVAEAVHPEAFGGVQQRSQLDLLEADHDNLRAAVSWLVEHGRGVEITGALAWFWYLRGHLAEGRGWLDRALAAKSDATPRARARALQAAGELAWEQAEFDAAIAYLEETRGLSASIGDRAGVADAVLNLGVVAEKRGDDVAAAALYEEALAIFRAIDDRGGMGNALVNLGDTAFRQGDLDASERFTSEALTLSRQLDDLVFEALGLSNQGQLRLARGDLRGSADSYQASVRIAADLANAWLLADALAGLAGVAAAAGQPEQGARWLGSARAMCETLGTPGVPHHGQFERSLSSVRAAMASELFDVAWNAGRSVSTAAIVDEALSWDVAAASAPVAAPAKPAVSNAFGLTDRELDVLRLLVEGSSSREIGDALYISPRTASTHVSNIFAKLGVNSRSAAVSVAFHSGLVSEDAAAG